MMTTSLYLSVCMFTRYLQNYMSNLHQILGQHMTGERSLISTIALCMIELESLSSFLALALTEPAVWFIFRLLAHY